MCVHFDNSFFNKTIQETMAALEKDRLSTLTLSGGETVSVKVLPSNDSKISMQSYTRQVVHSHLDLTQSSNRTGKFEVIDEKKVDKD